MNALRNTASWTVAALGLFAFVADLQAAPRNIRTAPAPNNAAPNAGAGGVYRSNQSGTVRQGMTVRGSNMNGLNYGMGYPGMNMYGYPGMNMGGYGYPGMNMGGYGYPGMNMGGYGYPGMNMGGYGNPGMNMYGYGNPGMNMYGYPGMFGY